MVEFEKININYINPDTILNKYTQSHKYKCYNFITPHQKMHKKEEEIYD